MKSQAKGFALTELIVVMLILGTLLSIVSLNFNQWQKKYYIENQAKELMGDLSNLRMSAIQTKNTYMAVLSANPQQITFRKYSTNEPVTTSTGVVTFTKNLKYPISNNPTGTPSCADIQIDPRGYTWSWQTIYIQPTGSGAAFDCLVVSTARINLGQYNGTSCTFK